MSSETAENGSVVEQAHTLRRLVDAAICELQEAASGRLSPLEAVQAEAVRQAAARLVECAERVAADGLMVPGSLKQLRSHPLLAEERQLRQAIGKQLSQLTFQVENRLSLERLNAMTRQPPTEGGR
jgi:hypothetical protein